MKKTKKIIIPILLLILVVCIYNIAGDFYLEDKGEIIPISSEKELEKIYNHENEAEISTVEKYLKLPFSLMYMEENNGTLYRSTLEDIPMNVNSERSITSGINGIDTAQIMDSAENTKSTEVSKDYSTTNIQVENVDEADITKTDGDYIYSLSDNNVIITDVRDAAQIKIAAKISDGDDYTIPEDLILYNDKLIVIYEKIKSNFSYYNKYNSKNTTFVAVYDISNKETPKKVKDYEIQQPYYTSRCINGRLYVIATGNLRKENDKIITYFKEDGKKIDQGVKNISKIKNVTTDTQTILSMLDLNNIGQEVKVNSYLMDIENAYVSENNIYLLDQEYNWRSYYEPKISDIFGLKGILGIFDRDDSYEDEESGYNTKIYKFNLLENGSIRFDKKAEENGQTINQFSIDEYKDNLRVALYDDDGSRVVIFDKNMKKIGETERLAEGEKMYSSRFLGDRVYLVTYKTIDPLFVIDLSNPTNPEVLGKLKIPGYSTYLHPYDENHLIGIGMQTEEKVNRNSDGKVLSTTATITGMKMALFDVTDVNRPIQISDTIIGDSRATSSILTNHKALLFSKEKQLIAIPVNNYVEDFQIKTSSDEYENIINAYRSYDKVYNSEGYFVYNINLTDGFKLKGVITHENIKDKYYKLYNNSRMLRGLYIDDNLYTVSENYIKINRLENLQEVNQLKIKSEK